MDVSTTSSNSAPNAPGFLRMGQGEGEHSYAKNSHFQSRLNRSVLPFFLDLIQTMALPNSGEVLRIADIGCSSGPNTICNVEAIIKQVKERYQAEGSELPEVQVFFQDLPSNDFNTLFKHVFSEANDIMKSPKNYMVAAVPGSFCHRLFPKATISAVLSTLALHWLVKIPAAVRDPQSPTYNGGHIDLHDSSLATVQAFADQAELEFDSFLAARADEVVHGGVVFLTFLVRQSEFYPNSGDPNRSHDEVWSQLVLEGSVSRELRDDFNMPYYVRTTEEVQKSLKKFSSVFEVQKQEVVSLDYKKLVDEHPDIEEFTRIQSKFIRAYSEEIYESHFGKAATSIFFERFEQALYERVSRMRSGQARPEDAVTVQTWMLALGLRRI
ncbi:hypothetical protein R1sor_013760 [Riccia sorocarpa]|uniref:Uncharacterized protein n=1 Tax=Riccia sorocarpa TaxID=122646 RepID=A0ABD3H9F7_9MARC